jgi:hypothetical protein
VLPESTSQTSTLIKGKKRKRRQVDQLKAVLANEVIKREVMEGDKAQEARKTIVRTAAKTLRAATNRPTPPPESEVPEK